MLYTGQMHHCTSLRAGVHYKENVPIQISELHSKTFKLKIHVSMHNAVFWDVTPCAFLVFLRNVLRLIVTANVVPSSPIIVTMMMEAICSSETRFLQQPHSVTSQKSAFLIVTAVKTSYFSCE
jgi:hypothetical protein